MARLKQFDSKYAPKNHAEKARPEGLFDTHHEAVMAAFKVRYAARSPEYREAARAFLESWRRGQPDGYYGRSPGELLLATTVATSIRMNSAQEEKSNDPQGEANGDAA